KPLGTPAPASVRRLYRSPQFLSIVALAVVTSLVETLVDYQFKATAAHASSGTELAGLFGSLYATASVASLFIQLFLVHRLLARAGVVASLCVLPVGLLFGLAGVVRLGSAGWAFAVKALDITLATTINGAARQTP